MTPSTRSLFIFFNHTATTEIYTLSLHDALPIWTRRHPRQLAGLTPQHPVPQAERVGPEQVGGERGHDVPGAALDLLAQLLLTPAGVAREDPQPRQPGSHDLGRGVQVDDADVVVQPAE